MLAGHSVVPLMTYLCQLGYTGVFLGDLWWLLWVGVHNQEGKP